MLYMLLCLGLCWPMGLMGQGKGKTKPKTVKGVYYEKAALVDAEKGKICTADSGGGTVLHFIYEQENPLFISKQPNMVTLYIAFKEEVEWGRTYTLPDPRVQVCYYEKGDLLMFHTFQGKGDLLLQKGKSQGSAEGRIDLKLEKPHHNMSNADYHYIGGKLILRKMELGK